MDDLPPNSAKSKQKAKPSPEAKPDQPVVKGEVTQRKPGLGKRFKGAFLGGDAKSAMDHMVFGVLIPSAKETMVDAAENYVRNLVMGAGSNRGPRRGGPPAGASGPIQYHRITGGANRAMTEMTRTISQRARAQHDFGEIVLQSRADAELVRERMYDILDQYGSVNVADLYAALDIRANHTDHKWGWTSLDGMTISGGLGRGYILNMPPAQELG